MLRLVCGCKRLVRGVTIWWLLAHTLAFAQTGPAPDLTSLSIEELTRVKVFSASRHMQDSKEAPAAVSIITADDIARYGWRTLADALRSLRGFYTAYDRNYTYLGVRGFLCSGDYNSRILLLLNGHRLNDNGYDSAMVGTELPLDLDLVDHIEIVRGPSSSMYGTNAVFGVINVITRRSDRESAIEISGDASSFLGRTGRISANLQKGRLSALLSGSMYRSTGQTRLLFPAFASPETNNGVAADSDGVRYSHTFADVQYGGWHLQGLLGSRTSTAKPTSRRTDEPSASSFLIESPCWERERQINCHRIVWEIEGPTDGPS